MINVLVMTHGSMSSGIAGSAQMILGPQECFDSLSFEPSWSLDTLADKLRAKLDEFGRDAPTLVLVDLFGGTPSNAIATLVGEGYGFQALAGANLPMVLEALLGRDGADDMDAYADAVCKAGRESIVNIRRMLLEDDED